ncbi:MAG: hypothetical protein CMH81_05545 [Nitrospiraceae bacterium]|nr:hypothetical protein [Nitrospiraceae bacterium]
MARSLAIRLTDFHAEFLCLQRLRGRTKVTGRLTIPLVSPVQEDDNETVLLTKRVTTFLKNNKIRNGQVFASIPREEVVLREIQLPLAVEENLQQVLTYELDRYTPFSKDEAHFAFEIVNRNLDANTLTLLLAAVDKARLQGYIKRLTLLGVTPSAIEITSTAMLNTLRQIRKLKDTTPSLPMPLLAMIDIHETGYELIITEGPYLRYTRSIPKSNNLMLHIGVELDKGIAAIKREKQDVQEVILGSSTGVQREHLTPDSLATHTGLHVVSAEPFASESMVLMGLGFRGLHNGTPTINLLPQQTQLQSPRRRYAPTLALIALLGCLMIGYIAIEVANNRATLKNINDQLSALSPQISSMTALQDQSTTVEQRLQTIDSLAPGHLGALDVLKELTTIVPDQSWLTNLTYKAHSVTLTGKAKSSPAHLISVLEHSALFYDVNFSEPVSGQEFRIQAKVRTNAIDINTDTP